MKLNKYYCKEWSVQALRFRPNPLHANYILNVYNMSYMYLNKILFKSRLINGSPSLTMCKIVRQLCGRLDAALPQNRKENVPVKNLFATLRQPCGSANSCMGPEATARNPSIFT